MHELILVRHGESEHHVGDLTGGWTDSSLTDRGRRQAERLGRALAATEHDRGSLLFSSDLSRARQTADAISELTRIQAEFRAELRESNNGAARNKTLAQAENLELPMTEPALEWVPYPGAESWRDMTLRVMGFMDELMTRVSGKRVVLVSHGNAMVAIVHWWLNLGEELWPRISFDFEPASITKLTVNRWGEKTISKLNDTSHLEGV